MCPFLLSSHMAGGRFELLRSILRCQPLPPCIRSSISRKLRKLICLRFSFQQMVPCQVAFLLNMTPYNKGHGAKAPALTKTLLGLIMVPSSPPSARGRRKRSTSSLSSNSLANSGGPPRPDEIRPRPGRNGWNCAQTPRTSACPGRA